MRKILLLLLVITLSICFAACGGEPANDSGSGEEQGQQQGTAKNPVKDVFLIGEEATIDGISISVVKATVSPMVGDQNAEGYGEENGEYFSLDGEDVKASDYMQITVEYAIRNDSDMAFGYSIGAWSFELPDGYKLETNVYLNDIDLTQVPSHSSEIAKVNVIVKNDLPTEKIIGEYAFMDYGQEYYDDLGKAMMGELTQADYEAKYKPVPIKFEIETMTN